MMSGNVRVKRLLHDRGRRSLIWGLVAAVAVIQLGTWIGAGGGALPTSVIVRMVASWIVILALALLASRSIGQLTDRLTAKEDAHRATLDEVAQLQTQNAMLQIVARSVDVPLTFQALAVRIARLVPCDRVGLALLTENGQEFETSTARVQEDERRARPRPDVVFKVERTAIGSVVRSGEPLLLADLAQVASEFLDVNVLHTAGFKSALIMPLISKGRGVGTLNVVARGEGAFEPEHIETLRPIAEILAVAHVAQRLHMLLGKYRTVEAMSEVMLSIAAEINSALQIIVGHCDLLERSYGDPAMRRDLATIVHQAQRISELLEKMRKAAHQRLKEVADTMEETGIPTSPEVYVQPDEVA
jgi:transcriptional regulator with GAF, ATPase, and Fis domain